MFILTGFSDEISQDIDEQVSVMESEGYKYIDLRSCLNKNLLDFTDAEKARIKSTLQEHGFGVSSIASGIGKYSISDDFGQHLERFKIALDLAGYFDTKYVRVFSYGNTKGMQPQAFRDEVMRRMKEKTAMAQERGLVLINENELNIYGQTAENCRDIMETVDSPNLRMIFDAANFVVRGDEPYPDAFEKLADYIEYLHIKDAKYSTGDMVFTLPGEGDSKLKEVLTALKKRNFSGFLSLEHHLVHMGDQYGATGEERFRRASKAFKKILNEIG